MYYIGIDLGTSAVKLLLMKGNGKIVRVTSREYPLYFPHPGWSQQNPEDWYKQSMDGLCELLDGIDKSQVAGISFGGQMHGLVVLDENDQVIRPAILWNDGRTFRENDYLNQVIGKEKLSEYTANISFTGFTAPKILWMKNNEPENFARIKKIMLPKDYLAYRLTGVHCTDVSDASGMLLFDVKNRCWSKEMLEWKSSTSPSVALLKRPPQSFIAFLLMRGQVNRPREKFRFKSIVPCFPARVKSRACIFCALIATLNAVSLTFS